jgi:hypothetical protein
MTKKWTMDKRLLVAAIAGTVVQKQTKSEHVVHSSQLKALWYDCRTLKEPLRDVV